ncbi:MAG: hypothetical protein ACYSWQ_25970 [Planctomycetota bacterium]|jgi:hypothetical protein
MNSDGENQILLAGKIRQTIEKLRLRIHDRFPSSGLCDLCSVLMRTAKDVENQVAWIEKPNVFYRLIVGIILLGSIVGLGYTISTLEFAGETFTLADLVQLTDSAFNNIILIGAAILFLISIESRAKRRKVIKCVNRLRSIAHLIDAHQLTKDPNVKASGEGNTANSPKRTLAPYELNRYLDYCSEMLSLVGKVGFLYVQKFDDPVAVKSVNDLETLTTALSRKVWQKIMILRSQNSL